MAENPTVFQQVQFGPQSTWGTAVAATRRMASLNVERQPQANVSQYRGTGSRFVGLAALNQEWSNFNISESGLNYNEIVWLLSSLIEDITPTGNGTTTPYVWEYEIDPFAPQTRQMYTIEAGSSDYGQDFANAFVSSLALNFNRQGCNFSGGLIAGALNDNQSLTPSLPSYDLIPVLPTQVEVKLASTHAGLTGAAALTRAFISTFDIGNFSAHVWPINRSAGPAAMVDTIPAMTGQLTMLLDSAGMALLSQMRAGTKYFQRVNALGGAIAGLTPADNFEFQVDVAMLISGPPVYLDHEGVQSVQWPWVATYDSTWGNGLVITVTNNVASVA